MKSIYEKVLEVEPLYLPDSLSVEEIAEAVRKKIYEIEKHVFGLTEEEITVKYAHGMCEFYADTLKEVLRASGKRGITSQKTDLLPPCPDPEAYAVFYHQVVVDSGVKMTKDESGKSVIIRERERAIYDIFGKHTELEAKELYAKEFSVENEAYVKTVKEKTIARVSDTDVFHNSDAVAEFFVHQVRYGVSKEESLSSDKEESVKEPDSVKVKGAMPSDREFTYKDFEPIYIDEDMNPGELVQEVMKKIRSIAKTLGISEEKLENDLRHPIKAKYLMNTIITILQAYGKGRGLRLCSGGDAREESHYGIRYKSDDDEYVVDINGVYSPEEFKKEALELAQERRAKGEFSKPISRDKYLDLINDYLMGRILSKEDELD